MSRIVPTGHEVRGVAFPLSYLRFRATAIDRRNIPAGDRCIAHYGVGSRELRRPRSSQAFIVSPAAADTLPTTTLINGPYNLVGSVSVSVAVPGALGSTGTTGSGAYFDYLYEFSISQDSYVTATIGPVDGSAFSEIHMMFYDVTPAGPDESLYTGADLDTLYTDPAHPNPNLIDVGPTAHWSTAGSGGQSSGGGPAPVSPRLAFRNLLAAGLRHPSATELALNATISTTIAVVTTPTRRRCRCSWPRTAASASWRGGAGMRAPPEVQPLL
jgi:hypothetical protein